MEPETTGSPIKKTVKGLAYLAGGVIALWVIGGWLLGSDSSSDSRDYSYSSYDDYEGNTMDRYDALADNWDEIKDYINGTETIEACSDSSGNCYDLDADLDNGDVDTIYFPNSGYLYFGAELNSDGEADGYDDDGNYWTFQVDEDLIDDALYEWASDNAIELE